MESAGRVKVLYCRVEPVCKDHPGPEGRLSLYTYRQVVDIQKSFSGETK